jgi:hypothetical protein
LAFSRNSRGNVTAFLKLIFQLSLVIWLLAARNHKHQGNR